MRSKLHLAAAAATAGVLVVTTGAWFGYQELIQPSCSGEIRLAVAVASETRASGGRRRVPVGQGWRRGRPDLHPRRRVRVRPGRRGGRGGSQARRCAGRRGAGQWHRRQPGRLGARLLDLAAAVEEGRDRVRSDQRRLHRAQPDRRRDARADRHPAGLAGQEVQLDRPAQAGQQHEHAAADRDRRADPRRGRPVRPALADRGRQRRRRRRPTQRPSARSAHWPPGAPRSATTCWPGSPRPTTRRPSPAVSARRPCPKKT